MRNHLLQPRGYVAVVSVAIISAILIAVVFAESTTVFWSRYDQLAYENHIRASIQAESCTYEGILKFAEDANSPVASTTVSIPVLPDVLSETCAIQYVATTSTSLILSSFAALETTIAQTRAQASTSASLVSGSSILTITSWRNITSTPP